MEDTGQGPAKVRTGEREGHYSTWQLTVLEKEGDGGVREKI